MVPEAVVVEPVFATISTALRWPISLRRILLRLHRSNHGSMDLKQMPRYAHIVR